MKQVNERDFRVFLESKKPHTIMDDPNGEPPHCFRYFDNETWVFCGMALPEQDEYYIVENET